MTTTLAGRECEKLDRGEQDPPPGRDSGRFPAKPSFVEMVRAFPWTRPEFGERLIERCVRIGAMTDAENAAAEREFLRAQRERNAVAVAAMRERQRWEQANFPLAYHAANFETGGYGEPVTVYPNGWTDPAGNIRGGNERALEYAKSFGRNFKRGSRGLILSSDTKGNGKTYFLCAALVQIVKKGFSVRFERVADVLGAIRDSYGRSPSDDDPYVLTTRQILARYTEPDVLCLDEMGGERIDATERGDWAREQMLTIVDARHSAVKTTCGTTNLSYADLKAKYGERIVSRLLDAHRCSWAVIDAPDHRMLGPDDGGDPFADDGGDPFAENGGEAT